MQLYIYACWHSKEFSRLGGHFVFSHSLISLAVFSCAKSRNGTWKLGVNCDCCANVHLAMLDCNLTHAWPSKDECGCLLHKEIGVVREHALWEPKVNIVANGGGERGIMFGVPKQWSRTLSVLVCGTNGEQTYGLYWAMG